VYEHLNKPILQNSSYFFFKLPLSEIYSAPSPSTSIPVFCGGVDPAKRVSLVGLQRGLV